MVDGWQDDLAEWLAPFVGLLGDRRRARMGQRLLCLEMQRHYVRISTHKISALRLMHMSDAEAELDGVPGSRVHGSWWVERSAVKVVANRRGQSIALELINGMTVPVIRARLGTLRGDTWFAGHKAR